MKIIAISDVHGYLPSINKCDILLICGDISPVNIQRDINAMSSWIITKFIPWYNKLDCKHIVFTPGNHDFWFEYMYKHENYDNFKTIFGNNFHLLIDDKITITDIENTNKNITIYGTPWCKPIGTEDPDNPRWAFILSNEKLIDKFNKIPFNIDILITHEAPLINGVGISNYNDGSLAHYGSKQLVTAIESATPKYALSGHVHTGNHNLTKHNKTLIANCSILDETYELAFKPLEFEFTTENIEK